MNVKRAAAIATCVVVALAAGWTFLVINYESDLGTNNTIMVSDAGQKASTSTVDPLVVLRFDEGAENLSWASMQMSLVTENGSYTCSFGSQSTEGGAPTKVKASLGADGATFTTIIDATDEASFTHLDLPGQKESDVENFTVRFSKTDAFFADGVRWALVEETDFQGLTQYPSEDLTNSTEERLEWYTYDLTEHRVLPNDGFYVLEQAGMMYKMQFLSYYNQADESRHPTIVVAALNGTAFPALSDEDLVEPSPCLIVVEGNNTSVWASNATVTLVEHGVQICDRSCTIQVVAEYETVGINISGIDAIE